MEKQMLLSCRLLGVVHVLVGILVLPLSMIFGALPAPLLAVGPLWLMFLGVRLWRPSPQVGRLLRRTHSVCVVVAALLCVHGALALRAAERSAAGGGGLLGSYGLIPLGFGLGLGITAVASLRAARGLEAHDKDDNVRQVEK